MGRAFATSYLAGEPAAQAFFAPGFRDPAARVARTRLAAERTIAPSLVRVLAEQQARLPPSAARQANLEALAAGRTAVVATGQQVGLFLGPLYSFYKAASAVAVARSLEAESGIRCVPLFWLQTEDHDFAEIRTSTVADVKGDPVHLTLEDEASGQGRVSVAHRRLPPQVSLLLDTLAEALPPGPAADEVLALLRGCYRAGAGMAAAFASTMAALFTEEGLLVFDPRESGVAAAAAPIYRNCIENGASIEAGLKQRETELVSAGFARQVPIRDHGALVFFHREGPTGPRFRIQRRAATHSGDSVWELAGSPESIEQDELLAIAASEPLRFSTSALLRPIVQDSLFPTAAYVGGPGEINYFAQLGPLYQHFGLAPPLLVPRARFRCVDARSRRWLEELGLGAEDVSAAPAELSARVSARDQAGGVASKELHDLLTAQILPALDKIIATVESAGAGMHRRVVRTRASVVHVIERLIASYQRALLERDQVTLRRLRGLQQALLPSGIPQERFFGWPFLAGRLGVQGFKREVMESLRATGPFTTEVRELRP